VHVLVSHVVIFKKLDQCKNRAGTLLYLSWKSPRNLLGGFVDSLLYQLLEQQISDIMYGVVDKK